MSNEDNIGDNDNDGRHYIPRTVNTFDKQRISLNHAEHSPIVQKVTTDTWEHRFTRICSNEGYNTSRRLIKKTNIEDWVARHKIVQNPVALFIEGHTFYNSINRQSLFVDFCKLRFAPIFRQPINYFSVHPDDEASYKLHTILKRENYYLETKPYDPQAQGGQNSIMPKMLVRLISLMYDSPEPDIDHVVIISSNWFLIDAIQHLRNLQIKVTLGIAKTQVMSNYYLSQFDDFIDVAELAHYAGALSYRRNYNQENLEDR